MNLLRSTILSILMIAFLIGCESSTSASSDSSSSVASSSSSVVKSSSSSAKSSSSEAMSSSSSAKSSSSNAISSSSSSSIVYSTIKDARDEQSYKVVKIGTQTWMAENLNFDYKVGSTSIGSYVNSDHPEFGRYYTWAAAMDSVGVYSDDGKGCGNGKTCSPAATVRGLCPEGFRMPNKSDFETLSAAVGGALIGGGALKSKTLWDENGNGTDAFGFSALPAGRYDIGFFGLAGVYTGFWSSDESDDVLEFAYDLFLHYSQKNLSLGPNKKYFGHSVRCIKSN